MPRRGSSVTSATVTSTIGGGAEATGSESSVMSSILHRLLGADEIEDALLVIGGDESCAELSAPKKATYPGERFQVLARRALRSDHAEQNRHFCVVDRLELDAAWNDEQGRDLLLELWQGSVR